MRDSRAEEQSLEAWMLADGCPGLQKIQPFLMIHDMNVRGEISSALCIVVADLVGVKGAARAGALY
jgi:hypothetical protein